MKNLRQRSARSFTRFAAFFGTQKVDARAIAEPLPRNRVEAIDDSVGKRMIHHPELTEGRCPGWRTIRNIRFAPGGT